MRSPLHAGQSIRLTHTVRKGTATNSYTVVLSRVSCHESDSVLPSSPGFAHSAGRIGATGICIFAGWSKAAPAEAPEQAADAAGQFLTPELSEPQTRLSGPLAGRWRWKIRSCCPAGEQVPSPAFRTTAADDARTGTWR